MQFSDGQLIFASLFFVVFVIVIFLAYRKDQSERKIDFRGALRVLLVMAVVLFSFFGLVRLLS